MIVQTQCLANQNLPKMMSIREVAKTGILPEHTLRLMIKQGLVPGTVFVGRKALINFSSLVAYLNGEEVKQIACN